MKNGTVLFIKIIIAMAIAAVSMVELKKTSPTVTTTGVIFMFLIFTAIYLMIIHIITVFFKGNKKDEDNSN